VKPLKYMKYLLILILALTGCKSSNKRPTGIRAPANMLGEVQHHYNLSRDCLKARGLPYNNTAGRTLIQVEARAGEKKMGSEWVIQYKGIWIGGLYFGSCQGRSSKIWIPVNPQTQAQWSSTVIRHELGHAHDFASSCWDGHDPRLAPCYGRWRNTPGLSLNVGGLEVETEDGQTFSTEIEHRFEDRSVLRLTLLFEMNELDILNRSLTDPRFFDQLKQELDRL
jgi:hypothetical protein